MKFRKKPVVIEAERYRASDIQLPFTDRGDPMEYDEDEHAQYIQTLEGKLYVNDGDWVIRGVKGEFYACKPDIFDATYELAERTDIAVLPIHTGLVAPQEIVYASFARQLERELAVFSAHIESQAAEIERLKEDLRFYGIKDT